MSAQDTVIDFSALELECRAAVELDHKYRRENDAKLRAVTQRVSSYQEFRDLVLASNLKPIHKTEREGMRKQPWNPVVTSSHNHVTSSHMNQ
ncbi:dynein axonemal assembly factor 19 [Synchiropus picturatus]